VSAARVHLALLTVAALFSLNYIISKLAMHAFHPLVFAYLRVLGSAIVLQFILPRDRTPILPADSRSLIGFALLGVVLNQTLFLTGLAFSSAHIAAILITTVPVFALGAAITLGRERATLLKVSGIAMAASGALLVVGGEGFEGTRRSAIGAMLIVLNSLSYALYLVLSKPLMARLSARRVIRRMFLVAAVVMIPVSAVPLWQDRTPARHRRSDRRRVPAQRLGAQARRVVARGRVHVRAAVPHRHPRRDLPR
jgi:drug/metabolite transporter (DMT)-like permease